MAFKKPLIEMARGQRIGRFTFMVKNQAIMILDFMFTEGWAILLVQLPGAIWFHRHPYVLTRKVSLGPILSFKNQKRTMIWNRRGRSMPWVRATIRHFLIVGCASLPFQPVLTSAWQILLVLSPVGI